MKSYKIGFLIGFHVSAVVGCFATTVLAVQGRAGPAITFAILSSFTAIVLVLWWIVRVDKYSEETRERIKKGVDVISLAFIAVTIGVILRLSIWGESPRTLGHLSIESKILLWDFLPLLFGFLWLLFRYANALSTRFSFLFPGLLFCFAPLVIAESFVFLERLFAFPDWVLAPLCITALLGFIWFAFRWALR